MAFDRDLLVVAVFEEVAHDLAGPVRFLELLLRDLHGGAVLDGEDLSIAVEELDRLRKLLGNLRRIQLPERPTMPSELALLVDHAVARHELLRRERNVTVTCEVPRGLGVAVWAGDGDELVAPLVGVALGSATTSGSVRIAARRDGDEIAFTLSVPTLERPLPRPCLPFSPPALDLLIARRVASSLGHRLELDEVGGGAQLLLRMPAVALDDTPHSRSGDAHPDCR